MVKRKAARRIKTVKHKVEKLKRVKKRPHVEGRHIPLKVAAVLFMLVGIVSILSGLLMAVISTKAGGTIMVLGEDFMASNLAVFMLGVTSVSLGIVEFLLGYGIWKLQRWAGIVGAVISVFSVIASIPYVYLNLFSGSLSLVMSLIILILLYFGWRELEGGF